MFKSQHGEGVGKLTSFRRDWMTCYILVETRKASLLGMDLQRGSCPSCSRAWRALRECLFLKLLPHVAPGFCSPSFVSACSYQGDSPASPPGSHPHSVSDLDGARDFVWRPFGEREAGRRRGEKCMSHCGGREKGR